MVTRARGGSGIPTGFDMPSLGWKFDNFVLSQGREHCQHWVDGDGRSTTHDVKPTLERITVRLGLTCMYFQYFVRHALTSSAGEC